MWHMAVHRPFQLLSAMQLGILFWTAVSFGLSDCALSPSSAVTEVERLRILSGPFTGGYRIAPAGQLHWYFANVGLLGYIRSTPGPILKATVKPYLGAYVKNLAVPTYTIRDVVAPNGNFTETSRYTFNKADSDDAYAATFLSLVLAYVQKTGDQSWARINVNILKAIAYYNLATQFKSNTCIRVYQSGSPSSSTDNPTGYLMDNSENYRGLADLSSLLTLLKDPDAKYYQSFANSLSSCIHKTLWSRSSKAFLASDVDSVLGKAFYPDIVAQVFPQAYNVPGVDAAAHYQAGYLYLQGKAPGWWKGVCTKNSRCDVFPWGVLGYAAAIRGDCASARKQQDFISKLFVTARATVTINELGWYLRNVAICR